MTAYLMVASELIGVELYTRQTDGLWKLVKEATSPEDSVELESIGCHLKLADLYEKVAFGS